MSAPLLQVENLSKHYPFTKGVLFTRRLGEVKAVDGVSFSVAAGEISAVGLRPVARRM